MKKVGIIGCGGIAQVHAWVLNLMENVELMAFCDTDKSKAESLASLYNQNSQKSSIVICNDWKTLCNSELDVIHICTPHYLHAPMAIEFLKSGKAVFVEKPCAINQEQFDELKKEDSNHKGKLGFCFQNRYNETTQILDKLVKDGSLGKLIGGRAFVTWKRDDDYYNSSLWKGQLATEGGGALINQSIHTLDLLLRYLGKPSAVKSSIANHHLKNPKIQVEDTVEAWLEFSDEKRACFYASNAYVTDAPILLELEGENGRVWMNGSEITLCTKDKKVQRFSVEQQNGIGKNYWGLGHKACINDFYKCLDDGTEFQNNLPGIENTFETVMKIYEESPSQSARFF